MKSPMDKIQLWKYHNNWNASIILADSQYWFEYSTRVTGKGKTRDKAIKCLCDTLMTLREEIGRVVHEENVNKL